MTFLSADNPLAGFEDARGGDFGGIGRLCLLIGVQMVVFGKIVVAPSPHEITLDRGERVRDVVLP
jgi:hypothetical protein